MHRFIHSKKVLVIPGIILIGLITWIIFRNQSNQISSKPQTQTVTKEQLVVSVSASGLVANSNSRSVTSNVSGVVKQVLVENGQTVKAGTKIAELELDQESQQTYTQAIASYQSAKNNLAAAQTKLLSLQATMLGSWDTYKELAESDTYKDSDSANRQLPEFHIPEKQWLAAEADYKNQQAIITQAQTAVSSAAQALATSSPVITAPISGTISGLSLMTNTVIAPQNSSDSTSGQTIATIMTEAKPSISINLTEVDVTSVAINDQVTLTVDALPEKNYAGRIISIDQVGSISTGVTSYPAVVLLESAAPELLANMSVQATIITDSKSDALLIPTSAITTKNNTSSVRLLLNGQTITQTVETGLTSGTKVEIVSGLKEGDQIQISTAQNTTNRTSSTQTTSPFSGLTGQNAGSGAMRLPR